MNNKINGIIATILFFLIFILILIFNKKIKKLINKKYFWNISLIIWFLVYLGGRYIPLIIDSINAKEGSYAKDLLYVNIFLTNICPMTMLILIIISTRKKWRMKYGPGIATWGILGGIIIGIGTLFIKSSISIWEFIFIKHVFINNNDYLNSWMYFISHLILLIHSLFIIIEKGKVDKNDLKYLWIYIIIFSLYVGLIMLITNQRNDVTGLSIRDWIYNEDKQRNGTFQIIGDIIWPAKTYGITSVLKVMAGITTLLIMNNLNFFIIWFLLKKKKIKKMKKNEKILIK